MSTAQTASISRPYWWLYRGHKIARNIVDGVERFSVWRPCVGAFGFEFHSFADSLADAMGRVEAASGVPVLVTRALCLTGETFSPKSGSVDAR